ncbi:hypothetical protein BJ138DRAFT_1158638 [Hygrophoropsis aurantiaca]|uniref:Uncharacterized protein n=1 Tax=Hygrophoropsis aurantiaca TaxID=72124 RepID=A0ACB8A4J5_9AGAM|nr:hypothetical protein BJ138DRAFT_1158638 [Hygrophoropsis aurantiaca]
MFTFTFVIIENETEVSFFNREAYDKFKLNPEVCVLALFATAQYILRYDRLGGMFDVHQSC